MSNKILYLIFAIVAFTYIGFLTNGIPFFWCDFDLLHHALGLNISSTGLFHPGPITTLITKLVYKIFSLNLDAFRFLKDIFFVAVALLIIVSVYKICRLKFASFLAGLVFVSSPIVLKSTLWACDFELFTQACLLLALICYLKLISSFRWRWLTLLLGSFFLGTQTTNGATFFALALALALIFQQDIVGRKRFLLIIDLFFLVIIATRYPLNTTHYTLSLNNIQGQLRHLFSLNSYIVGLSLILSVFFLWKTKDKALRMVTFWFWIALLSQVFYQRSDFQFAYELTLLVPLVIAIFSGSALFFKRMKKRPGISLALMLFFIVLNSLRLSNPYRGAWGSLFVGFAKTVDYLDANNEKALVVYQSVTPDFQSLLNKNSYLNLVAVDTAGELKKKLDRQQEKGGYQNIYLIRHIPDRPRAIDEIKEKKLITTVGGATNFLYDRLKDFYREQSQSTDQPNQFQIYKYR